MKFTIYPVSNGYLLNVTDHKGQKMSFVYKEDERYKMLATIDRYLDMKQEAKDQGTK